MPRMVATNLKAQNTRAFVSILVFLVTRRYLTRQRTSPVQVLKQGVNKRRDRDYSFTGIHHQTH
jgi:hypothetical protein